MDVIGQVEPQVHGPGRGKEVGGRDVGILADVFGIDFKEKLGHRRVGGNDDVGDLVFLDAALVDQVVDDFVEIADDRSVELVEAVSLEGENDPRDDILAEADLGVVLGVGRDQQVGVEVLDHRAFLGLIRGVEVQQLPLDRSRADVNNN